MTDDEIRDVFAELLRIGVDLSQPPGLALGTGFRDGEFLAWLRALPDDLGHVGFVERLRDRVNATEPNVREIFPGARPGHPHRMWPTVEQMHAAIEILRREWDPMGARLGDLTADAVTHHAYNALRRALSGESPTAVERKIASLLGAMEEEAFGIRRSPQDQRRYLARRLIRVVADQPGPRHEDDPWGELRQATAKANGPARRTRGSVESRASSRVATNARAACAADTTA